MFPPCNKSVQAFTASFDTFMITHPIPEKIGIVLPENVDMKMMTKNISQFSNESTIQGSPLPTLQPDVVQTNIFTPQNESPGGKTTLTEQAEAQNYAGSKYRHGVTDQFRYLYGRFYKLLVQIMMKAPTHHTVTSSLQKSFNYEVIHTWLSHLLSVSSMMFMANDTSNDQISDFLRRNWTESRWFHDFIKTIVDKKVDMDFAMYFSSLDPLWDLWEENQRTKELNSQLTTAPSLPDGIHTHSFLLGVLTEAVLFTVLHLIYRFICSCCCRDKKAKLRKIRKRRTPAPPADVGPRVDSSFAYTSAAIWDKLVFDAPPAASSGSSNAPNKTVKPPGEGLFFAAQSGPSALTPETAMLPAPYSHGDVASPPSSTGSPATTTTTDEWDATETSEIYHTIAQSGDTLERDSAKKGDDSAFNTVKAIRLCHSDNSAASASKDSGKNEQTPRCTGGLSSTASDSRHSDVWIVEAFTTAPDLTNNFGHETTGTPGRLLPADSQDQTSPLD
ncbi:hypothetical protein TWF281_003348 [Arthrobotrys megalospora]